MYENICLILTFGVKKILVTKQIFSNILIICFSCGKLERNFQIKSIFYNVHFNRLY